MMEALPREVKEKRDKKILSLDNRLNNRLRRRPPRPPAVLGI